MLHSVRDNKNAAQAASCAFAIFKFHRLAPWILAASPLRISLAMLTLI